jgi:hypothetical protein
MVGANTQSTGGRDNRLLVGLCTTPPFGATLRLHDMSDSRLQKDSWPTDLSSFHSATEAAHLLVGTPESQLERHRNIQQGVTCILLFCFFCFLFPLEQNPNQPCRPLHRRVLHLMVRSP